MKSIFFYLIIVIINSFQRSAAYSQQNIIDQNFRFKTPLELGITFDDLPAAGPDASFITRQEVSDKIIKTLKDNKIPEVYGFINGILLYDTDTQKKILSDWKNAGYLLANHTFSHFDLSEVKSQDYIRDIERNETILADYASNISEFKIFRYPYLMEGDSLDKRYSIRSYLKKRNYKIAQVSIDTGDWEFNDAFIRCKEKNKNQEIDQIVERYIQNAIEQVKYNNSLAKFIYGENKKTPQVLLVHYNPINAYYLNSLIEKLKTHDFKDNRIS